MSWSVGVREVTKSTLRDSILEAMKENTAQYDLPEVKEQIAEALNVVELIIDSGCIGTPEGNYNVQLSGHANTNHEKREGWSNDTVTIAVYQS